MTVMTQLVNVSSSADLIGNPWVCDCLMFNTIYSWCRNNSVDLKLVCSSPPEFKGKPWEIYEHSDCDNDNTGDADPVQVIASINHTSPCEYVAKIEGQLVPHSSPRREQVKLVKTNENYFYISIALSVIFLGLVALAGFLWWCGVRPCTLRLSDPAKSGAESQRLFSSNV